MAIYLTNTRAFYRISLIQKIDPAAQIFVIGCDDINRDPDFSYNSNQIMTIRSMKDYIYLTVRLLRSKEKVVLGGWNKAYYFFVAMILRRNRLLLNYENFMNLGKQRRLLLKRIFLLRMGHVITTNVSHAQFLEKFISRNKISVSPGVGFYTEFYERRSCVTDKEKNLTIIYLGRPARLKNLSVLTDLQQNFDIDYAGFEGSSKNVKGYIPRKELQNFLSKYDILILPSLDEPWGLVVQEALLCGCSVITSATCGVNELWKPWIKNWRIVKNQTSEEYARAIRDLISQKLDQKYFERVVDYLIKCEQENLLDHKRLICDETS